MLTVDVVALAFDEVDAPEERKEREVWEEGTGVTGACVGGLCGCEGVCVDVCVRVNVADI